MEEGSRVVCAWGEGEDEAGSARHVWAGGKSGASVRE